MTTSLLDVGDKEKIALPLHPYGIGIDTHKGFIQVCLLVQVASEVTRFEAEFTTAWPEIERAKAWVMAHLTANRVEVDPAMLRYTIESTGTYHQPVLLCWQGLPSVVNPLLAGPTRRKTDVLDARMLAHQSIIGMWPASFIPSRQAEELRILVAMRNEAGRGATRACNRVNNHILRFGHTLGREFSMTDSRARGAIEDMCEGRTPLGPSISPIGIPEPVRCMFTASYKLYDYFAAMRKEYHDRALQFVRAREWPMGSGTIKGKNLLANLQTVPGVGEVSALTWLSVVCDPRRFQVAKQVAAFCGADPSLKVSAGKVTSHVRRKGNARLHHVLKNVAAQLVRRHSDPLGQWGYALFRRNAKGGWGRAINAVSRRLAICLWHVHRVGHPFSYEQYRFYVVAEVRDVPIEDMDISARYKAMLLDAGLSRTGDVARTFLTTLPQQKGIGAGCLKAVKQWIDGNKLADPPLKGSREGSPSTGSSSEASSQDANGSPSKAKKAKRGGGKSRT